MNSFLKWFSIITWIGIPLNLYFAVPALFIPDYLVDTLNLDPEFETVWLRNAGLLIFIVTLYNAAAAYAPVRYPAIAWLVVGGRLSAALYWLIVSLGIMDISSAPNSFIPFLIGDLAFGVVSGALLYFGLKGVGEARKADVSSRLPNT